MKTEGRDRLSIDGEMAYPSNERVWKSKIDHI
jgi:hypothetical protein